MPTKFKRDEKIRVRGSSKVQTLKHFIRQTPLVELLKYINNDSGKPKVKQKCRNEIVRRGYKIVKR